MTRMLGSGCAVSIMLTLAAILSAPAETKSIRVVRHASVPAAQGSLVEIPDPGKTDLAPGRYKVELEPGIGSNDDEITLILYPAPSGRHHRYPARATGCGISSAKVSSWAHTVTNRRDGSLRLELVATSPRGCKVAATIPAVAGIEGTPVGTAGAPGKKAPGIEGSPVGTAGAPPKPGVGARRMLEADREIEGVIDKAREVLPQVSCAGAPRNVQARLTPLQSALQEVAGASSAAAAVQPLRRFEAARQAMQKALVTDPASAAGANRCADAERRCGASSSMASACGIDAGVCLARLVCAAER